MKNGGETHFGNFSIDDSKCRWSDSFEPVEMHGTTRHGHHEIGENPSTTYCTLKSKSGKQLTLAFESFVPRNETYRKGHVVSVRVVDSPVYDKQDKTWGVSNVVSTD